MPMINLPEHHLRLAMEGIYKSRKSLQKWPWEPYEIKAVLFNMAATFGFPLTKEMMPEIYEYIIKK